MLTKENLKDANKCEEKGNCTECSMPDGEDMESCIKRSAQTAITIFDMLKRLVVAVDTDVNIFKVNDNTQNALNAADKLLKEVEG